MTSAQMLSLIQSESLCGSFERSDVIYSRWGGRALRSSERSVGVSQSRSGPQPDLSEPHVTLCRVGSSSATSRLWGPRDQEL